MREIADSQKFGKTPPVPPGLPVKVTVAVASIADRLVREMADAGSYVASAAQTRLGERGVSALGTRG